MGANGVFYRFGDKTGHVAGVPCKVGDTNGAGDTAAASAWHFQILSDGDAFGAVFYGAPVGHDHALIAPAFAQDVGQKQSTAL